MNDLWEIFSYQVIGFLLQTAPPAYALFGLFRREFRFPAGRTWKLLGLLLCGLDLLFSICVILGYAAGYLMLYLFSNLIFTLCILACLLFFMYMIEDDRKKKLFAFLLMLNYACLILWLSNILLYRVPAYQRQASEIPYGSWTNLFLFFQAYPGVPACGGGGFYCRADCALDGRFLCRGYGLHLSCAWWMILRDGQCAEAGSSSRPAGVSCAPSEKKKGCMYF